MAKAFERAFVLGLSVMVSACSGLKSGVAIPDAPDATTSDGDAGDRDGEAGSDDCDAATGFAPWYLLPSIMLPSGAVVTGAESAGDTLFLFAVDTSQTLYVTEATAPIGAGAWSPWTKVGGAPAFPPGAPVTAVARNGGIDLYGITVDQALVTRQAGTATWVPAGPSAPVFPSPQPVAAVARDDTHVHMLVANDGGVWESTQGYGSDDAGAGFSAWALIGGAAPSFPAGSTVTVVARPNQLDAIALASDSRFYDSARSFTPTDTGWQPWIAVADPMFQFSAGSVANGVAFKDNVEVDLFTVQGCVLDNPRNLTWGYGDEWFGWYSISSCDATPDSSVVAAAGNTRMDVFYLANGRVEWTWGTTGWSHVSLPVPSACGADIAATSVQVFVGAGAELLVALDTRGALHATERSPPN